MVTPSDDTAALVHLAKIGSADAFRRLLESQYAVIFRMAFRLCGHREDAEDITQMTCLKIAQTIGTFRGDAQFTTWAYTVTLNTYRDWVRVKANNRARHTDVDDMAEILSGSDDPERNLMLSEQAARVRALPEAERDAVLLVFGEGLSHKQAGEVLGCAESTVSWRIMEARKKLTAGGGE
ncbi:MAG: sigma-70 family RNA polymerase sigma factor [Alphaproteobacteria bacterium]|jgi:RNA polymerase sigma-70 factor, ECF subfamily|nr:sigma-70 family RNA polymerase sigma factor [Alphaproteobacteria bacterium]MBP9867912.1 sigma-70 family RNA polymerase sigma factor [Alphaproteobacteria bacterium]